MDSIYLSLGVLGQAGAVRSLRYCEQELESLLLARRSALRCGRTVIFVTDADGQILEVSPAIVHQAGQPASEMIGRRIWEFVPRERRVARRQLFLAAVVGDQCLHLETETAWGWAEVRIEPIHAGPTPFVLVVMQFVSRPRRSWRMVDQRVEASVID